MKKILAIFICLVLSACTKVEKENIELEKGYKSYKANNIAEAKNIFINAYNKAKNERIKEAKEKGFQWLKSINNPIEMMKPMKPFLAFSVDKWEMVLGKNSPWVAYGYLNLAFFDIASGRYTEAKDYTDQALHIYEIAKGPKNPDLISWFNYVGKSFESKGKYKEAENVYKKLLAIEDKLYGEKSLATVDSVVRLGGYYERLTLYENAESYYRQSLDIVTNKANKQTNKLLLTLLNLARCLDMSGKYYDAEKLYEQIVNIGQREELLESEAGNALENAAWFYNKHGQYSKAEKLFGLQLNAAQEEVNVSGQRHDLVHPIHNLIICYQDAGRYDKAVNLCQEMFSIYNSAEKVNKIDLAHSILHWAMTERGIGNRERAEALAYWALTILEENAASSPAAVTDNLGQMTNLFSKLCDQQMANSLYQESCDIAFDLEKLVKPHWQAVSQASKCATSYAAFCFDQGNYVQAANLYKQAIASDEAIHGNESLDIVDNLFKLGDCYVANENWAEAVIIYQRIGKIVEKSLGRDHLWCARARIAETEANRKGKPTLNELLDKAIIANIDSAEKHNPNMTAKCYVILADKLLNHKFDKEAKSYFSKTIDLKKQFGPSVDFEKEAAMYGLARIYFSEKNWQQAESIANKALLDGKACVDVYDVDEISVLANLEELLAQGYLKQGKRQLAEPHLQQALLWSKQVRGDNHPKTKEIEALLSKSN